MRKLFTILNILFFSIIATAQYGPQYTHFMFNKMEFNPAYAGSAEVMTMSAIYRHQWQGIEGAPRTATLFGHTPFSNNRGGIGLSLTSDRIGMTNSIYAKVSYAYRLKLKNHSTLSLGLSGTYEQARLDWSKATMLDKFDSDLPIGQSGISSGNFGVGVYYQNRKFFVGASIPYLLKNSLYNSSVLGLSNFQKFRHFYFMSGIILPMRGRIIFKPSVMMSYIPNAPFEVEINANFLFAKTIWLGASYRIGDAVSGLVQYQLSRQMKLGVAYDYSLSDLTKHNSGSFEVLVEYTFDFENDRLNNIRYF